MLHRLSFTLVLLLAPSLASAQLENPRLHELREQLAPYGPRTVAVLEELARFARTADRRREIQLATYLLAMGSVDVWIVARRNRDVALEADLARVHGVPVASLRDALTRALTSIRLEPFTGEVDDALAVLRGSRERGGIRGDLLFADSVMRALGAVDPVRTLAGLADDPCADEAVECPEVLRPFDAEGRQAIQAVLLAQRATALVRERAALGDPLAAATVDAVVLDRALLSTADLAPRVTGFESLGALTTVSGEAETAHFDVILRVDSTEVRYAFVPRVAFDAEGAHLVGEHGPLLPSFATLALPPANRAFPEAVPELVTLLRSFRDSRVAFAPSPTLSTMDLWRVVRSAHDARTTLQLAALDSRGQISMRPLEWRDESDERTEVYVRLGGYSVRSMSGARDLPRVRGELGWSYDVQTLRTLLHRAPAVAVRAMHDMPVAPLVDVLFSNDRALLVRR